MSSACAKPPANSGDGRLFDEQRGRDFEKPSHRLDEAGRVGAKTAAQLEDNLGATRLQLTADDIRTLDDVSALPREYPGWMIERQGEARSKPPVRD